MQEIISWVYLLNAVISIFAYVPQIVKLRKIKSRPKNFSVASWSLWTYTSLIFLLYALIVIKDIELIIVGSLSFILVSSVLTIVLYKNRKYKDVI